jgi:hypothetical protein
MSKTKLSKTEEITIPIEEYKRLIAYRERLKEFIPEWVKEQEEEGKECYEINYDGQPLYSWGLNESAPRIDSFKTRGEAIVYLKKYFQRLLVDSDYKDNGDITIEYYEKEGEDYTSVEIYTE